MIPKTVPPVTTSDKASSHLPIAILRLHNMGLLDTAGRDFISSLRHLQNFAIGG